MDREQPSLRLRVCLLVNTVGYDAGAERQVLETALRLDRGLFDVHLCCLEDSPRLQELANRRRIRLFPVRSVYTLNGLYQIWRFRRYLEQEKIQIVHTYMEKAAIFGVLAAAGRHHNIVITSRLNMGYWYTAFYRSFFRLLNRFTTRIMANSESVKQITMKAEGLAAEKIDVIYQGVDTARYGPESGDPRAAELIGIPAGAEVVGIVANLRPIKDVELFLKAAGQIAHAVPSAVFLVVGSGPLRQALGQLAVDLHISGKVFFSDGRGTVPDHLRRMCIGCLSSQSEGFSNAILEYMAAGLPVVATDVGGNREQVLEGQTGYLVRGREPAALAEALLKLLRSPSLRASMGRRGLERCRELFDIAVTIRRLEQYYAALAAHAWSKRTRYSAGYESY